MRKIRFHLSTTQKPLSKLIRLLQSLDFSHCAVEVETVKYETTLIYEAKGLNSYVINKDHFEGEIVHTYEAIISEENHTQILKYILRDAGTPYAWKTLFGFVYVTFMKCFGARVKNPWPEKGKVCSESCGEILVRFFGVSPDVDYDDMDLIWVAEKLREHPILKEV